MPYIFFKENLYIKILSNALNLLCKILTKSDKKHFGHSQNQSINSGLKWHQYILIEFIFARRKFCKEILYFI